MKGKKTGGRQKGTPNRVTLSQREIISSLLKDYAESGAMSEDFAALDARERLQIAEKLMQYTMPKYQSVSLETSEVKVNHVIEDRLLMLSVPPKK